MRQRVPRAESKAHLKFVASLPCLICGWNTGVDAAHIRFSDASIAKDNAGVGAKPHDYYCVPLCRKHHEEQHKGNERLFWTRYGLDGIRYAMRLKCSELNYEDGLQVIKAANERAFRPDVLVRG